MGRVLEDAFMAAAAFGWGLGAAALGEAAAWDPLAAPLSLLVPVAAFGSARRGDEPAPVLAGGVAVAYAAYAGLAAVRALRPDYAAPFVRLVPDALVLGLAPVAGLPLALLLATCVALPFSLGPRARCDVRENRRFWSFVQRSLQERERPVR